MLTNHTKVNDAENSVKYVSFMQEMLEHMISHKELLWP